jgi:hypothetical protein
MPDKTPMYQVYFNDLLQTDWNLLTCTIGQHNIKIKLLNKNSSTDTMVDDQGKVIHDLAIELSCLKINQFDITHNAKEHAVYIDEQGITVGNTYGYMYKNGTLNISFTCPAFYHTRNLNLIKE